MTFESNEHSHKNLVSSFLGQFELISDPHIIFSSPVQRSLRATVLPSVLASALTLAAALASASTNVKVFDKVWKTSFFSHLITDLIHLWYDDTYWSKTLRSTIPTTLGHVKVKVTELEF